MDIFLPSGTTMPNHPNLDKTEAAHGGLPTPPPLTETPQSPLDENTSPDEVVAKCRELQASNASLWSQVVNLQAQNDYWVQVYDLIEKGLAAKVREMDVLVQENTQLKATNAKLSQQLQERFIKPKGGKPQPDEVVAPIVLKQIRHLQDQVRARDLVINLMKKAEQERSERDLRDKLERQRKQIELQFGFSSNPSPSALTKSTVPESSSRSGGPDIRGAKTSAKMGSATRTLKAIGGKRKRISLSETCNSTTDGDLVRVGNETIPQEKSTLVDGGGGFEVARRVVKKAQSETAVEGDSLLEKEVDQALEELFNEIA